MVFHVQVSGKGLSVNVSSRYNLTEEQVRDEVVTPWELGQPIVAGGKAFDSTDSEVQIREGTELDASTVRDPVAWLRASEYSDDVTDRFIRVSPGSKATSATVEPDVDPRRVAVVHGRDDAAKKALFGFLRDLDLHPLEWNELVRATGSGAPNNRTIVEKLFSLAAAVVVLLTPDEEVRLHPAIAPHPADRGEGSWGCQPRPNVFLEAGMALAFHPDRTVLVEVGVTRSASDLAGVSTVRLDGTAAPLHDLATRLKTAGCSVNDMGDDWLRTDRFVELEARVRLPTVSE